MEFVAIDFEKLNDNQLSVCEVGLVVFKDGKEVGQPFHSYLNPVGGHSRNDWAKSHLGHISDEMLLKAPSYEVSPSRSIGQPSLRSMTILPYVTPLRHAQSSTPTSRTSS